MNIEPFKQWLPSKKESEDENLRADYFYLAKTHRDCYKCNKSTLVWAIILPEGFEAIDEDAMEDLKEKRAIAESTIFYKNDYLSLVSHLTYISQAALDEINKYVNYSFFQKRYSASVGYSYYRSICQHCNSAQGDNYTITESNCAFLPINIDDFKKIQFYKIPQKIKIRAGTNTIDYGSNNSVVMRNIWKQASREQSRTST